MSRYTIKISNGRGTILDNQNAHYAYSPKSSERLVVDGTGDTLRVGTANIRISEIITINGVAPSANRETLLDQLTQVFHDASVAGGISSLVWFDYNDLATTATPIAHTGGANTYLTNDELGVFTNSYNPTNIDSIWDSTTNKFDFTDLNIGDTIILRVDLDVTTTSLNQELDFFISLAMGSGSDYIIRTSHESYKATGVRGVTYVFPIYMGNVATRDNPAGLYLNSVDDATITVNGWFCKIDKI